MLMEHYVSAAYRQVDIVLIENRLATKLHVRRDAVRSRLPYTTQIDLT